MCRVQISHRVEFNESSLLPFPQQVLSFLTNMSPFVLDPPVVPSSQFILPRGIPLFPYGPSFSPRVVLSPVSKLVVSPPLSPTSVFIPQGFAASSPAHVLVPPSEPPVFVLPLFYILISITNVHVQMMEYLYSMNQCQYLLIRILWLSCTIRTRQPSDCYGFSLVAFYALTFHSFLFVVHIVLEPRGRLKRCWVIAGDLQAFSQMHTWDMVPCPQGVTYVDNIWVYKVKY